MPEHDSTLTLSDCTPMAKVLVHAPPDGAVAERLGVPFGRSRRNSDGTLILRVRPAEWLIFGDAGKAAGLTREWEGAAAETDEFVSVLDVTPGRAVVRLTGDHASALLAKVCALDLDSTTDGSAFRSSVAKVNAEIIRTDEPGGQRSYLLACERSYGSYLIRALADAGAEFSIDLSATPT